MFRKSVVVVLLLLCGWVVSIPFRVYLFNRFASSPAKCDAAIILAANSRRGQPSQIYKNRIEQGIELFKSGRVQWLIFTGGHAPGAAVPEARVGEIYARSRGIPADRILLESISKNTYQNLYFAREAAEAKGIRTFFIVTDPYHMMRAMTMADDLGLAARPSANSISENNTMRFLVIESIKNLIYQVARLSGRRAHDAFLEAENY